jgi:plastocyanin
MRLTFSVAGTTALLLMLMLSSADAAVIQIKMANVAYAPAQVSAHVGDTVEWTNDDVVAHTATARNGAWDLMIQPKSKASTTLKSPGTIEYYCRLHPNMVGSIMVLPTTNANTAQ